MTSFQPPLPRIDLQGADPTGIKDSRPALQRAIDAAAAKGGASVYLPKGTYLLDSYRPSTHPWKFYNLRVPSNVTLDAEPGAILKQGNGGRAPLPARADYVENDVLAVGTANYQAVTFQSVPFNGGLHSASSTANSSTLALENASDSAAFSAGDFVSVYAERTGDVIEAEPTQLASVDRQSGVLTLAQPLARSFPHPLIANVTKLATSHVSLRNLTIQGAVPLAATEVFDLSLYNCRLVYDAAASRANLVTGMIVNTIRGFRMENGAIEGVGENYAPLELPQRDSQDVVFQNVAFNVRTVVFGEYAAHWKLLGNHFSIHPDSRTTVGLATGGLDVLVEGNVIQGGNLTAGGGSGAVLSDGVGPASYMAHIGRIQYRNNQIECRADGNNCLRLTTADPVVDHNRISATGTASGIKLEAADGRFTITSNTISVGSSPALVFNVPNLNVGVVKDNNLSGTGPYAILVAGKSGRELAERLSIENSLKGFAAPFLLAR